VSHDATALTGAGGEVKHPWFSMDNVETWGKHGGNMEKPFEISSLIGQI
jgi:hypothetical protein